MIMKYQQVSVDLVNMVMTACSYLALAGAAWVLLRLLQACFWLPRHFKKQNNVQRLLQDKVDRYEKYLAECEAKDKLADVDYNLEDIDDDVAILDASGNLDKWHKQRESLEMLKRELDRVRDDINVTDWDYLLKENQWESDKSENGHESEGENKKGPRINQATKTEEEKEQDQEVKDSDGKKDKYKWSNRRRKDPKRGGGREGGRGKDGEGVCGNI